MLNVIQEAKTELKNLHDIKRQVSKDIAKLKAQNKSMQRSLEESQSFMAEDDKTFSLSVQ